MEGLESLVSKNEITELVHRYAFNIRQRKHGLCAEMFTEDSSFEVREAHPLRPETLVTRSRAEGRDAVIASIGVSGGTSRVFPAIHNLLIDLDGDSARITALMLATVYPGGGEMVGEYDDTLRREQGKWLFKSRCYTIYRETWPRSVTHSVVTK